MSLTYEHLKAAIKGIGRGLPQEALGALESLAATSELAAVFDREDEALQEHRRSLLAKREELPRKHKSMLDRVARENNAAQKAVRDAEQSLAAARDRASTAAVALYGADFQQQSDFARIDAELDATADPRIQRLIDHCSVLLNSTRDASWSISWEEGRTMSGRPIPKFLSNIEQVQAMREEIGRIQAEAAALKRRPMLRHQVTTELKSLLLDLDAAVAAFDLSLIRLGDLGDLVVDDFKSTQDLCDRAIAASKRAADSSKEVSNG